MKKLATVLGITILGALLAIPAFSWANGWGWGGIGNMMGNSGRDAGYGCPYDDDDTSLTAGQQEKLSDLDRKLSGETKDLKRNLWSKSSELNTLLGNANPDLDQIKAVRKEISALRDALDEKNIGYEIEARKIAPERGVSGDDGERQTYGMGYGRGGC